MLDDRDTIDQIVVRREALSSLEAAEAEARRYPRLHRPRTGRRRTARRLRSTMPQVWQAWHDGRVSTTHVIAIDRAATRLVHPESIGALDDLVIDWWSDEEAPRDLGEFSIARG